MLPNFILASFLGLLLYLGSISMHQDNFIGFITILTVASFATAYLLKVLQKK